MSFSTADLAFLTSAAGAALLAELATADLRPTHTLALLTRLRRQYPPDHARAALELAQLRQKAAEKFGADAARLFFTRAALEQASDHAARSYRTARLRSLTAERTLLDACCGIGADALTYAQAGLHVTGYDLDAERLALARLNAAALGVNIQFEQRDVTAALPPAAAIFFDPARRTANGQRLFDVDAYHPPLATLLGWQAPLIAVKLAPGVDLAQLQPYGGQVEFLSVAGDLKEAVLWRGAGLAGRRATLITPHETLHWDAPPTTPAATLAPTGAIRAWLVEPDAALLRAGVVQGVAEAFDGVQLDATIAYFTTHERPLSPWLRAWQVLDWLPFNLKRLRAALRARDIGTVTVKKRGFPLSPEELTAQLKLSGTQSATLVMTRWNGEHVALICADYVQNTCL